MMMTAEPQAEHRWLEKLVGEWVITHEGTPGDAAQDEAQPNWSETVRSLQGVWMIAEGRGQMPGGGTGTTVMTLGYDSARQRFVGTFIASMMTHLWVYEGVLNDSGTELTLETEGSDFEGRGTLARYQDVITFEDENHRVLSSRMLVGDGSWKPIMTARYRRKP
jgi:hypothetical protein